MQAVVVQYRAKRDRADENQALALKLTAGALTPEQVTAIAKAMDDAAAVIEGI